MIYTADLHGNIAQYKKLIWYSKKVNAKAIIIGGDIAPGSYLEDIIEVQKNFIANFPCLLKPLQKSNIKLFLMMGNDDCACNLNELEKGDPYLYKLINEKRLSITEDFDIVGYPYVPITPFKIKDWEKFDLSYVPKEFVIDYFRLKKEEYNLDGFKSEEGKWRRFHFNSELENNSIQADLCNSLFSKKPDKTIYIMHSPPYKTNLDLVSRGHIGSIAVRLFIEKYQPYLTLHGHVHETVQISGNFKDNIGKTLCMSPGNERYDNKYGSKLSLLEFNLYNPKHAKRIIL